MKKLLGFLIPCIPYFLLTFFCLGVQAIADLYLPALLAEIVDSGVSHANTPFIIQAGIKMLIITLIGAIGAAGIGFTASRAAALFARDVRKELFVTIENFSLPEFDSFSTASLITRSTSDIHNLHHVLMMVLRMLLLAPIMAVGSIIMALRTSPQMNGILVVGIILVLSFLGAVFLIVLPQHRKVQKLTDTINRVFREHLSGLMVIRSFRTETFEMNRFDETNKELTAVSLFVNRIMVLMNPTIALGMNILTVVILLSGSRLIGAGDLQVGQLMAFMQYAMHAVMSFLMISVMFIALPRAVVSASRIAAVLSTEPSVHDPNEKQEMIKDKIGEVVFHDVSFKYELSQENVLSSISFTAKPRQTTAIIGATGSGKTTLLNLIPRFYDVSSGRITVGGVDIRLLDSKSLRETIGYVPQKGSLLTGSIDFNIRYGKGSATDDEVKEACSVAQAYDFVIDRAGSFEAQISEGGMNVSGGQRQRLAIARALIKKPSVYLFDDSFSAVDFKTDVALRRALKEYTSESAVIIVAQRINTIMNADKILVLEEGCLIGEGRHHELMENCKVYKELALSQLSSEELL